MTAPKFLDLDGFQLREGAYPGWDSEALWEAFSRARRVSRQEWKVIQAEVRASPAYQEHLKTYGTSATCVVPRPPEHVDYLPFRHPSRPVDLWVRRDGRVMYVVDRE